MQHGGPITGPVKDRSSSRFGRACVQKMGHFFRAYLHEAVADALPIAQQIVSQFRAGLVGVGDD